MSEFAAVVCYFNPLRFQTRLKTYTIFEREFLKSGARLVTVELAFGEQPFELPDAPHIMKIRTPDVMWQKERLLNLGIRSLPPEVTKVAWIDADILFESHDWPERVSRALDHYKILQCFDRISFLPKDSETRGYYGQTGWGSTFNWVEAKSFNNAQPGFAWAARRDIIERHGIYDSNIIGNGDTLTWGGALYDPNLIIWTRRMLNFHAFNDLNRACCESYMKWAVPFGQEINGNIGYLKETIFPLYHGKMKNRLYNERNEIVKDFNPYTDIRIGDSGCWYWNSDKAEMHMQVREYFMLRDEDG